MYYSSRYWIGVKASDGAAEWNDGTSYPLLSTGITAGGNTAPGTVEHRTNVLMSNSGTAPGTSPVHRTHLDVQ